MNVIQYPSLLDVLPKDDECESHVTVLIHKLSKCLARDLKLAHLNICSLRNKIDEFRCLQLLCKFEVLGITETHLDETVLDDRGFSFKGNCTAATVGK